MHSSHKISTLSQNRMSMYRPPPPPPPAPCTNLRPELFNGSYFSKLLCREFHILAAVERKDLTPYLLVLT